MVSVQYGIETLIDEEIKVIPYSGVFTAKTKSKAVEKANEWYNEKGKKLAEYFNHTLVLTEPVKDIVLKDYDSLFMNELDRIESNKSTKYIFYVDGEKEYTCTGYDSMMYYKLLMDNFCSTDYEIKTLN